MWKFEKYDVLLIGAVFLFVTSASAEVLKSIPLNGSETLISKTYEFDKSVSSDGNGSVKIVANAPTTIELLSVPLSNIEETKLLYSAKLKAMNLSAPAYLEMWLNFPGQGEFFSKGVQDPINGTSEWVEKEIPFMLQKGQKPDRVKLNVVLQGTGTIWVDDIKLEKAPL